MVNLSADDYNTIEIIDISGRVVRAENVKGATTTINNLNFDKGVYFLRVMGDNNTSETRKFIKQ